MNKRRILLEVCLLILLASIPSCRGMQQPTTVPLPPAVDREKSIPGDAIKMSPETDENPPVLFSDEFESPVPVPGQINTAGAEDGVFITPDGGTMYFFFTPDVRVPVEKQILDGVTGLYVSHKTGGAWEKPERIILQDPGKLALDGCEFVQGNFMFFCSAREGITGVHWFTAEYKDGLWRNWKNADFNPAYQVGELHISPDGSELYFGSKRPGGKGGLDIWVSRLVDGIWQEPENITSLNTADDEGWPALDPAGNELWITRNWGVWRSKKIAGEWQNAELVVSPFAGEASIDEVGNLYFVHHFYVDDSMVEADIYVAYRKR